MLVDEVPLLLEEGEEGLQEEEGVLAGQFEEEFGDAGVEVVLVDHLVEVPQSEEERLDDVGEGLRVEGGGEEGVELGEDFVHGGWDCLGRGVPMSITLTISCCYMPISSEL